MVNQSTSVEPIEFVPVLCSLSADTTGFRRFHGTGPTYFPCPDKRNQTSSTRHQTCTVYSSDVYNTTYLGATTNGQRRRPPSFVDHMAKCSFLLTLHHL